MFSTSPIINIVDDDELMIWIVQKLLQGTHAEFRPFSTIADFLGHYWPAPHECLIYDLRIPEANHPETQNQLLKTNYLLPIIFISTFAKLNPGIKNLKKKSFHLLEKEMVGSQLRQIVDCALSYSRELHLKYAEPQNKAFTLPSLSQKKRQILNLVASGKSSCEISGELSISARSIEN